LSPAPSGSDAVVAVGVDGCAFGWIATGRRGDDGIDVRVFGQFEQVLECWPEVPVAVDMPIGLAPTGTRASDRIVRSLLGPRRSSVFPPPPRAALGARSYAEACALRRQIDGKAVSAQTWNIFAKIAEVDRIMTPALQDFVIEAHPELSFTMMNKGIPAAANKKTHEGRAQRLALLSSCLSGCEADVVAWRPRGAAHDDLLDALAVLWTAERFLRNEAQCRPEMADCDERGLRMEIWY
jgi:predicted RNase H-like nuclease